jgi:hypothetical protein
MIMDRFANDLNIKRFRILASGTLTPAERAALLKLLAKEEAKHRDLRAARIERLEKRKRDGSADIRIP